MSAKVVVTGAAGFIGSHLCEALLDRGFRVLGIDAFTSNYDIAIKKNNIEALKNQKDFSLIPKLLNDVDLDDVVKDADYVFHLAAQPGVRQSWHEQFDEYVDSNIRATHRLCEAVRKTSVKKLVYASSSSVYGETTQLPMSEAHPTRPLSPYGVTKLSAECLCLLYRENFGVPIVALRFFTVYGPRQRADMAFHRFIEQALDGQPITVFGNGSQTRDFTFVADIVDANLRAMEYNGEESVFNVGGGSRVTLNTALDILLENFSGEGDVRYSDVVAGDVTHTYADITRAKNELGYNPKVELAEGIAQEVDWLKQLRRKLKNK